MDRGDPGGESVGQLQLLEGEDRGCFLDFGIDLGEEVLVRGCRLEV